jgi:hypothetical protein
MLKTTRYIIVFLVSFCVYCCISDSGKESTTKYIIKNSSKNIKTNLTKKSFLLSQYKTSDYKYYLCLQNSFNSTKYIVKFIENSINIKDSICLVEVRHGKIIAKFPQKFYSGKVQIVNLETNSLEYTFNVTKSFNPIARKLKSELELYSNF